MAKQILVHLKRNDRVNEIIPYVEKVAHPGMKVVFLMRYPIDGLDKHIQAGRMTGETGCANHAIVRAIGESYSWEAQQRMARHIVLPACQALLEKGTAVTVEIYSGSLSKVVKNYACGVDLPLILQRAGLRHHISRFVNNMAFLLRLSKRSSYAPMLSLVANGSRQ